MRNAKTNQTAVEKLVKKYFPTATYNAAKNCFEATIKHFSWDEPAALIKLHNDWSDAAAQAVIAGSTFDNAGQIAIKLRS